MSAMQVSRSVPLTSTINTIEEHAPKIIENKGIVTILEPNFQQNHIPPSLRRTLSADMSSKKWLSQNGMSQMKRVSSFQELVVESIEVDDDDQEGVPGNMPTHDDVWRSIQSQKEKGSFWSSILSEKKDNNSGTNDQTPPYVHPLLRKSTSNLSQKSLAICTESLGSETGSEGFSAFPPPPLETNDDKENEKQENIEPKLQPFENVHVAKKYNYNPSHKKVSVPQKKSFPPPLPSLSSRNDGCPSLQMQSHRKDGRLVLEAVTVPQQNYLQVDRQEGRLLLTLINKSRQEPNTPETMEEKVEHIQEMCDNFEKNDVNEYGFEDHDEEQDKMTIMIEKNQSSLPTSGMINIPMMKSFLGMGRKDSLWSNKINKVVEFMEAEQVVGKITSIPQSLPPPPVAVARLIPLSSTNPQPQPQPQPIPLPSMGSFNVYEYFWRRNNKSSVTGIIDSSIFTKQCSWNNNKDYNNDKVVLAKTNNYQQEVVIMRGNKGDYFVPLVCKENRRSLLVFQPHCIATS